MTAKECSIGAHTKEQCNLHSYSDEKKTWTTSDFTQEQLNNLQLRLENFFIKEDTFICHHHKLKYLDYYTTLSFSKCCDPFSKHKKTIKTDLREISLDTCVQFNKISEIKLTPGEKVCSNCRQQVSANIEESHKNELDSQSTLCSYLDSQPSSSDVYTENSQENNILNKILDLLNINKPAVEKLSIERKNKKLEDVATTAYNKIYQLMHQVYGFNGGHDIMNLNIISDRFKEYFKNLSIVYNNEETSYNQKIQILTLMPDDWGYEVTYDLLKCTRRAFYSAKKNKEK